MLSVARSTGVPRYPIRRIPQCGKCHTPLPEAAAVKVLRRLYRARVALIAAPCLALVAWMVWKPQAQNASKPAAIATQLATEACVSRMLPDHGLYDEFDASSRPARLTIRTAPGSFYLVNLGNAVTGHPALQFFAYGGTDLNAEVPLGSYKIKYAAGSYWCGSVDLFGSETVFSEAEDEFLFERTFTSDGYITSHWTIELTLQKGGNLRTRRISRGEFFGRGSVPRDN